jgi:Fic family protein
VISYYLTSRQIESVNLMLFASPGLTAADRHVLDRITALRSDVRYLAAERRRWEGLLRGVALARAIRGSNSIEGFDVSVDDAFAALDEEEPLTASDAAWAAVSGYRDAMTYVLQLVDDPDFEFEESLLRSLHFMMQSYDLSKWPGRYRPGDIYVYDEDGERTVYAGPDARNVPTLMHELAESLTSPCDDVPPLIRAALAHLNLVMIHPFKDGNGRMARCLQALVLVREEGVVAPEFCSIEEYLGRNEKAYYDVLLEVGGGSWSPQRDASAWIRFCLVAHYRQLLTILRRAKEAERYWTVAEKEISSRGLPERMVGPLFHALSGYRIRNSTYRQIEPDVSANTASRDLTEMVGSGLLDALGEKRGRHYVPVERLRRVHVDITTEIRSKIRLDEDPYEP